LRRSLIAAGKRALISAEPFVFLAAAYVRALFPAWVRRSLRIV